MQTREKNQISRLASYLGGRTWSAKEGCSLGGTFGPEDNRIAFRFSLPGGLFGFPDAPWSKSCPSSWPERFVPVLPPAFDAVAALKASAAFGEGLSPSFGGTFAEPGAFGTFAIFATFNDLRSFGAFGALNGAALLIPLIFFACPSFGAPFNALAAPLGAFPAVTLPEGSLPEGSFDDASDLAGAGLDEAMERAPETLPPASVLAAFCGIGSFGSFGPARADDPKPEPRAGPEPMDLGGEARMLGTWRTLIRRTDPA